MTVTIGRRELLVALGGAAAAWPLAARAQQPVMPVIGLLAEGTPNSEPGALTAFHQGLRETGYVERQNVQFDYRWTGQQRDLLLALTADLVRRDVTVIYSARGSAVAQAAKAATTTIPIVFTNGGDPVKLGLVASLNRPGGNVTGTTFFSNVLTAKRLTLLRDLVLALTADLVRRDVTVIYSARGSAVAQAAKSATTTIPIVFTNGGDPVKLGLVASLNRPGGNVTGTTFFSNVLTAKRLTLLRDLMPSAVDVAVLINPTNANADTDRDELQAAAQAPGLRLKLLPATNEKEIDAAFAAMAQDRPAALFVAADAYFFSRSDHIIARVARLQIPAIYPRREQVLAGGLVSYATDTLDSSRVAGTYVGRILKGEKPGDLPVQQPTKFKLVINLKTAKALGIEIPPMLLSLADEVIE